MNSSELQASVSHYLWLPPSTCRMSPATQWTNMPPLTQWYVNQLSHADTKGLQFILFSRHIHAGSLSLYCPISKHTHRGIKCCCPFFSNVVCLQVAQVTCMHSYKEFTSRITLLLGVQMAGARHFHRQHLAAHGHT